MDAKVIWQQGMHFTGTATTGFELPLGAGEAEGGANDGFRPLELMAVSLAGCTAMDVISILKKKQQVVRFRLTRRRNSRKYSRMPLSLTLSSATT